MTAPTSEELGMADTVYLDELGDTEIVVFKYVLYSTGWQVKHDRVIRYQKNTAMINWSPCSTGSLEENENSTKHPNGQLNMRKKDIFRGMWKLRSLKLRFHVISLWCILTKIGIRKKIHDIQYQIQEVQLL